MKSGGVRKGVWWAIALAFTVGSGRAAACNTCLLVGQAVVGAGEEVSVEAQATSEEAAQEASPSEEAAIEEEIPKAKWVRGRLELGLDWSKSSEDSDVRTEQYLQFEMAPPEHERLRLRSALWLREDLDADERYTSALRRIDDASDSSVQARLLYLYLEADDLWGDSTVRIGRQRILESPAYNRIDGVFFKQRHGNWDWYAFGGVRASVYEDAHDSPVAGAGASIQLVTNTRIALDAFYGKDDRDDEVFIDPFAALLGLRFPRRVKEEVESRMVSLTVSQQLSPRHHLHSQFVWFDGAADELTLSATGFLSARDIAYELSYRRRLNELGDRTNDLTGYYRILGELEEYDDFLAAFHIPLNDRFTLSLEGQIHDAENDSLYTANRDYERYAIILSGKALFAGTDASLALENWDVEDGEGTWAVTGEVSRTWDRLKAAVGADYERYEDRIVRYRPEISLVNDLVIFLVPGLYPASFYPWVAAFDTKLVETHENLYSIYGKIDYELAENQGISAQVTYEVDDGPDSPYWRLKGVYTVRF